MTPSKSLVYNIYTKLKLKEIEGFEIFEGQPLRTDNKIKFMIPVYHKFYGLFLILVLNPLIDEIVFFEAPELLIKLNTKTKLNECFRKLMVSNNIGYIVYHLFNSNPVYTNIDTLYKDILLGKHDRFLFENLKINSINLNDFLPKIFYYRGFTFLYNHMSHKEYNDLYVYTLFLKDDLWQVYQIVTVVPINNLKRDEPLYIRVDSGCTAGQLLGDRLCDCYSQMHNFLSQLKKWQNGFLLYIPAHEGRGVGLIPKIETELYKLGLNGKIHQVSKQLNTIDAAKLLYHTEDFDIRTYEGAAHIVANLGFKEVIVFTDNKIKMQALKDKHINVTRYPTNTSSPYCQPHIDAKHKFTKIYFDS